MSLAGSVFLTLGLVEAALQLVPGLVSIEVQHEIRADPRNYGVAHPYIGYLHRPHNTILVKGRDVNALHHTDGYGFRNSWPWPERAEIVILGDSMVFGHGVADDLAWPAILARSLPQNRVINLGLLGAGPQQYLRVYETFGRKLQPKLLVVGVFLQNDFSDAETFDTWEKSGVGGNQMVFRDFGRPERVSLSLRHPITSLEAFFKWRAYPLLRKSHIYNLLRVLVGRDRREQAITARNVRLADGSRLRLLPPHLSRQAALAQPGRREFQLLLQALQRLHSIATQDGAQTVIVLQPGKEMVYLPLLGETVPDPASALREALEKLGIDYLDLTPGFRDRAAAGEKLFFEYDGHPNAAGYALIAQLVLSHLKQNGRQYALSAGN